MDKIRVLFITDSFVGMGGAEKNLLQVATGLDKNRFSCEVYCLQGGSIAEELIKNGIPVQLLQMKRIYGLRGIKQGIKLFKYLREKHFDAVITYHESSDFWGGIIAALAGVPLKISNRRDMGFKLRLRHIFIYRFINMIFDRIIVVSHAVGKFVNELQKVSFNKIVIIHNGIDADYSDNLKGMDSLKESLGIKRKKAPIVGLSARLSPIKGHACFLESIPEILKFYPETYFLVIGNTSNAGYYKHLKGIAEKLRIGDNLIFTGAREDMREIISFIDIGVMVSLSEGLSNSILEYMASGKPVVATNVGGNAETVMNAQTGLLIPPSDPKALSEAVLRLLDRKDLAEKMGRAGKERARECFGYREMITKTEKLLVTLLSEKNRGINGAGNCYSRPFLLPARILKTLFSDISCFSGITSIIRRREKNNGIAVLAFHRVKNIPFDPLGMSISESLFEANMKYIKNNYNVFRLEDALLEVSQQGGMPERSTVITFDDGYRDNYSVVFPILLRYGIPATIFLSVDAINTGTRLWYDVVMDSIRETGKKTLDLSQVGFGRYQLSEPGQKYDAAKQIVRQLKYTKRDKREKIIGLLKDRLEAGDIKGYMLKWDDINAMKQSGIDFGSHGMSHSILTTLSTEEMENEISESKKIILNKTGINAFSFAYPNGEERDFNKEAIRLLNKHNYRYAFTLKKGINRRENSFELKRYCMSKGMITDMFESYSGRIFDTSLLFRLGAVRRQG